MPTGNKAKRASRHVAPNEDPDERLKRRLQQIAELDFEGPEQRAHERGFAIIERLSLELQRLTDLARATRATTAAGLFSTRCFRRCFGRLGE
jgi:hypothetical protein